MNSLKPLTSFQKIFLFALSLGIVGFGQPAFSFTLSILSALFGYGLIWRVLLNCSTGKERFCIGSLWFCLVQLIQLSWMISHPYMYIYFVLIVFSLLMGLQFGLLSYFIQTAQFKKIPGLFALAGLWAILEWSRLFFLSGFSWNPAGLALSAELYSLQTASLFGVFGMSFWVIAVNLFSLKAWIDNFKFSSLLIACSLAVFPYFYGYLHVNYHAKNFSSSSPFKALLVQTAFPIEESMGFKDHMTLAAYVIEEWKKILLITKEHLKKPVDLVALPEFAVPFGTYTFIYPHSLVAASFKEHYGANSLKYLPPLTYPLAEKKGNLWMVNNAYWAQGIANNFNAELIIGLEDAEDISPGILEFYSSAVHFSPNRLSPSECFISRYDKRVLVPMGEYIPFSFAKKLAESYGISGSFTAGKEAKILGKKKPMGVSICYEETFGDLMRENKVKGAELLVNLTSDIWYPNSRLPRQHLDHSRLRSVENGVPLLRACNTGITCGVDSLGRTVASLSEEDEWKATSLFVKMPTYHFSTLYTYWGDRFIIALSSILVLFFLRSRP